MSTSTEHVEHLVEDIRVRLVENRYDDPALANDLLAYAMAALRLMASGQISRMGDTEGWASRILLGMQSRATAGGWPEPPEHPWETVLSGDGDLG